MLSSRWVTILGLPRESMITFLFHISFERWDTILVSLGNRTWASSEPITLLLPWANSVYTINYLLCLERHWVPKKWWKPQLPDQGGAEDSFGTAYLTQMWLENLWRLIGRRAVPAAAPNLESIWLPTSNAPSNLETQDGPELDIMAA